MRILLVTHRFFPLYRSGTEVLTLNLAQGLIRRGHSVNVLSGMPRYDLPEDTKPFVHESEYQQIPVYYLNYGAQDHIGYRKGAFRRTVSIMKTLFSSFDPIALHFNAPDRVQLLLDTVNKICPNIIHAQHIIGLSSKIFPVLRGAGYPLVFTPTDYFVVCPNAQLRHNFDGKVCNGPADNVNCIRCFSSLNERTAKFALKVTLNNGVASKFAPQVLTSLSMRFNRIVDCVNYAQKILPSTNFLANILVQHGVENHRIDVLPYGVNIGKLPPPIPIPAEFTINKPLVLGFIGQFTDAKAPHLLLEAINRLNSQCVRVLIYGDLNTPNLYAKKLLCIAKLMSSNIQLMGTFLPENISIVLRGMHALVVPSVWYESAPLVLCSALAAKVPAIVSNLGGLTEMIKPDETGYIFDAGSVDGLVCVIKNLIKNADLLKQICNNDKFPQRDYSSYLDDIEKIYQQVI